MAEDAQSSKGRKAAMEGRLLARPQQVNQTAPTGLQPLGPGGRRNGLLYVPSVYRPDCPAPLVLMLHGAGGNAEGALAPLKEYSEQAGYILLAPESRQQTWDIIVGHYGPDVAFIDRALKQMFERYSVNPARIAIEGFSDGASYALSLGITNGDLFTHVIAFSPGFLAPASQHGSPRLFISHGTGDQVLPIDACSRKIVPQLKRAGYEVGYREFDGPHTVPPYIAREALEWFRPAKPL